MIIIENKQNCCGCGACAQVCPMKCVTMSSDTEGFLYPSVDNNVCINCGLCEKICPEIHLNDEREPISILAAINKNESVRLNSSSGGIFYLLAERFIKDGGVVFGARFDENWQVVIDYTDTLDAVQAFMGSKYVQARTEKAYIDAKKFLQDGRSVLFSGTPCQIAGLKHFLHKEYDNLLTVDIVCHGTPSPKVWDRYLNEVLGECGKVKELSFRNKTHGWRNFSFKLTCDEKDETLSIQSPALENPYMKAFLKNLILRPSCYDCKFKSGKSHSDITLADFWGIWNVNSMMDDDKGTSMVFVNTNKGENMMLDLDLVSTHSDYATARTFNPACWKSPQPHPKRAEFFSKLETAESLPKFIYDLTAPTLLEKSRCCLSKCKRFIIRIVMGGRRRVADSTCPLPTYLLPISNPKIVSILFRNKQFGWKSYSLEIQVKDNTSI